MKTILIGLVCLLPFGVSGAEDFPVTHFSTPPAMHQLWLTPAVKSRLQAILGHPYPGLRVRYWESGGKTAWVLDETGKEQPITAGIVIKQGKVESLEILAYRESRGSEVQQSFFTHQFEQAALDRRDALDKKVDGISGATLSVSAVSRMARAALALDAATRNGEP